MQLNELLSSTYPFTTSVTRSGIEGEFVTKEGHEVNLVMTCERFGPGIYDLEFGRQDPKQGTVHNAIKSHSINGKEDAYKILATVIAIVKDILKKKSDIEYIYFTADEPSRQKLYRSMCKRMVSQGYKQVDMDAVLNAADEDDPLYGIAQTYSGMFGVVPDLFVLKIR